MINYREIYPNLYLGLNYSPIDLNLINIKGEYSIGDILVVENYKSKIMIYIIENNKALLVTNNANNYLLKEDLDILIFTKYK